MNASLLVELFYAVILASAVITVIYLLLINQIISLLQKSHHDTYVEMGEPSLLSNNNISNSARLVWFLISGNYRALADSKLSALGRACRVLILLGFCGYIYCFVILTYYWQVLRG